MRKPKRRGLRGTPQDHLRVARNVLDNAKEQAHDNATCGGLLRAYGRAMQVEMEAQWGADGTHVGRTTFDAAALASQGRALEDSIAKRIHETCFCKPKRKR
jgi:hypothetical protein